MSANPAVEFLRASEHTFARAQCQLRAIPFSPVALSARRADLALFLRYQQGIRIDIEADPFDDLRHFLASAEDVTSPLKTLRELVTEEIWDRPRPTPRSTWFDLLKEFFTIHSESIRPSLWPAQLRILRALCTDDPPATLWANTLPILLEGLEDLSAWRQSTLAASPTLRAIQRAPDSTYYIQEEGRTLQVVGARTLEETKLEYVINDSLWKYGHVHRVCRFIALYCLSRHFRTTPENYPSTIRVTLPEDGYLHWGWYHLRPFSSPRVPWRPPDRHSDPESLALDMVARYLELSSRSLPLAAPEQHIVHETYPFQYEQAIDTDLRIGDDDEALIVYKDKEIRWINGTRTECPILVVGALSLEAADEAAFVAEFLSVLCFETNLPFTPLSGSIGQRRAVPTIRQPRKLADHVYSPDLRLDVGRSLSADRRLALALYREGISARSGYYQFLSLYKILQIRRADSTLATWINAHANDNMPSVTRIKELRSQGDTDLAKYLWKLCRNAIVHVNRRPRANPDDLAMNTQINQDVPIVRDLARKVIKSDFLD